MSIQRIHFQTYNRPLLDMLIYAEEDGVIDEKYDFSPSYQRASVWTTEQRVALIKSLLQGLPVGAIFLNRRRPREPHRVVDGKQRLETILMWIRDEVAVPADWFGPRDLFELPPSEWSLADLPDVHWGDLSTYGQRRCGNDWAIATYETTLETEAQEAELYERINFGETPHERLEAVRAS